MKGQEYIINNQNVSHQSDLIFLQYKKHIKIFIFIKQIYFQGELSEFLVYLHFNDVGKKIDMRYGTSR